MSKKKRVLVIGDTHEPFTHPDYLQHCIDTYKRFDCNHVVHIGDLGDFAGITFHETNPDGLGVIEEMSLMKNKIKKWNEAFPKVTVLIGNHCRRIARKMVGAGIPSMWIPSYPTIYGTKGWKYTDSVIVDGVLYEHGEAGTARTRCLHNQMPTVQGHLHTQAFVEYFKGKSKNKDLFAMQVGTGIDFNSYAFNYAKRGKQPQLSCGVVLEGKEAFVIPMR